MKKTTFNFHDHRYITTVFILAFCAIWAKTQEFDTNVPMCWAIVPGYDVGSTTGGGDGEVVTATTLSQLRSYASSSESLVILVGGTISGDEMISVASDKTILGQGSNATLLGVGLKLTGVSNIIIRNLTITGNGVDAIALRETHHVWIDHCDVSNCSDGLIDITRASDLNTVSWTRFSKHAKTFLINSGTDHDEDIGMLSTTVHHNWWDGSEIRNPRVGYGKVHVLNCLYNNNEWGIGLHSQARVLAEQNYFNNTNNPIQQMYPDAFSGYHGFCEEVSNVFNNTTGEITSHGISFPVDDYYMYDFMLDSANHVLAIVPAGVGPAEEYGEIGLLPTPGQGAVRIDTEPTLKWTKGTAATGYIVSLGTTNPPPQIITTTEQTYSPESLSLGTEYYWSVDQVTSVDTIKGKVWKFRTDGPLPDHPFVYISSPSEVDTFPAPASITLEAIASDSNGTVKSVEFFKNIKSNKYYLKGPISLGIDTIAPYTISWEDVETGTYDVTARATNSEGFTYNSSIVKINVKTVIPFAKIIEPPSGTRYTMPVNITITADASDEDGNVVSVEFFHSDSISLGVVESSPYSITWNDVPPGRHFITARVTDNDGRSFTSNSIRVIVKEGTETRIDNQFTEEDISLYPNPVSEVLTLYIHDNYTGSNDLVVYNCLGKVMMNVTFIGKKHNLNLEALPGGIYFIVVTNKQKNFIMKIIKE
jgi:pectate lyase